MRLRLRRVLIVLAVIIVAAAIPVIGKAIQFSRAINDIAIGEIDLTAISDGVYRGAADVGIIAVSVEVTVSDGAITHIQILRHVSGKGTPAEAVVDRVIESQTLQVEAVAGATYSSRVILKAVENALRDG